MSKYLRTVEDKAIPKEDIGKVYDLVAKAVAETDIEGKTTDKIFGEIYTRFRAEVSIWERHPRLRKLFLCRLKHLNFTKAGKQLNEIINELCQEKMKRDTSVEDLELCAVIMRNCLSDAKGISDESARVMSTLEQISDDLNGENYV
jgi:hypothetical protein